MTAPTYATLTSSVTIGGTGQPAKGIGRARQIQTAELNIAAAVAAGLTTGQSVKLVNIPANSKVLIYGIWNKTALVGTSFTVGDSSDEAIYMAANSTTTINTYGTVTTAGLTGTNYTAADFLSVKLTVPTSGTIAIFYEILDMTADTIAVVP